VSPPPNSKWSPVSAADALHAKRHALSNAVLGSPRKFCFTTLIFMKIEISPQQVVASTNIKLCHNFSMFWNLNIQNCDRMDRFPL
jgi:hypothetical protein